MYVHSENKCGYSYTCMQVAEFIFVRRNVRNSPKFEKIEHDLLAMHRALKTRNTGFNIYIENILNKIVK